MRDKYKNKPKKKVGLGGESSQSQTRVSSRRTPSVKTDKGFPSSANLKNSSQISRRKPKNGHMSASYGGVKKGSEKGKEGLRGKKRATDWDAPESLTRGSKKRGSNSPNRGKAYDKKKLSKVVALFNKEVFLGLDIKNILNNWRILQYVFLSLGGQKPLETAVNTYFLNCYRKQYDRFLKGFTKYNKIRKKIFVFMLLEFWAFFLLFYFHYQLDDFNGQIRLHFENILTHLTKNTFYIGLILLKAASNRVLDLNVGYLQDFVNRSQTFNFATGVPLIKTLRSNNENAYEGIKSVLQFTNRNLNKFFIKCYSQDFSGFDEFVVLSSMFFGSQFQNPQKFIFKKMQDSHFYGKETFSGKYASDLSVKMQSPLTAEEFIKDSLNPEVNSWKTPKMSRTLPDKKTKREGSLSEKQVLDSKRAKASVRSRNSGTARSKISSKYSIQQTSQSRKAKGMLSSKNYKLKVSNSKRFKDLSAKESPRRLKEGRGKTGTSKKKLERSLRKHSAKAFKNSRQHSVREKEQKMSKKQKNSSIVSSSKGNAKGKSGLLSSDLRLKKKQAKTEAVEKLKNTYSSKRGMAKMSREASSKRGVQTKKALAKGGSKTPTSRNNSQIR